MSNLRDTIEGILIDSTKGISTYEASMVNIIINKDQATEAILQAFRDVVGEEWHHNSEKWCAGANTRREHILKELGVDDE